jgi:hypothetical protein
LPLVLLAGCDKPAENDERSASGEVLQGTISDAMLPLDKLKSKPPLLAPTARAKPAEDAEDEANGDVDAAEATSAQPEGEATPAATAPTATPSPVRGGSSPQG